MPEDDEHFHYVGQQDLDFLVHSVFNMQTQTHKTKEDVESLTPDI